MSYFNELSRAMTWLGEQPDTVFLGQSVAYSGNAVYETLNGIPPEKRVEMPVAEDMQMGISIGLGLAGHTVISIYPRFDFLLLAVNQLVNHLDKIDEFTHGEFHTRMIIRVGIGARKPLYPGVQHCGDYTDAFRKLLRNIDVIKLESPEQIVTAYQKAYKSKQSSLIVEDVGSYDTN